MADGRRNDINEFDLCNMLKCPIDAPKKSLRHIMNTLKAFAEETGNTMCTKFLIDIDKQFKNFLEGK